MVAVRGRGRWTLVVLAFLAVDMAMAAALHQGPLTASASEPSAEWSPALPSVGDRGAYEWINGEDARRAFAFEWAPPLRIMDAEGRLVDAAELRVVDESGILASFFYGADRSLVARSHDLEPFPSREGAPYAVSRFPRGTVYSPVALNHCLGAWLGPAGTGDLRLDTPCEMANRVVDPAAYRRVAARSTVRLAADGPRGPDWEFQEGLSAPLGVAWAESSVPAVLRLVDHHFGSTPYTLAAPGDAPTPGDAVWGRSGPLGAAAGGWPVEHALENARASPSGANVVLFMHEHPAWFVEACWVNRADYPTHERVTWRFVLSDGAARTAFQVSRETWGSRDVRAAMAARGMDPAATYYVYASSLDAHGMRPDDPMPRPDSLPLGVPDQGWLAAVAAGDASRASLEEAWAWGVRLRAAPDGHPTGIAFAIDYGSPERYALTPKDYAADVATYRTEAWTNLDGRVERRSQILQESRPPGVNIVAGQGDPPDLVASPPPAGGGLRWGASVGLSTAVTGLLLMGLVALVHGLTRLNLGLLPLFSRIDRGEAANHDARRQLLSLVEGKPGLALPDLYKDVGRSTVRHHVRVLLSHRLVRMEKVGGVWRLYPPGADLGRGRQAIVLSQDPTLAHLVSFLRQGPVSAADARRHLQAALSLTASGAWKAVSRAQRAGLVALAPDGRTLMAAGDRA